MLLPVCISCLCLAREKLPLLTTAWVGLSAPAARARAQVPPAERASTALAQPWAADLSALEAKHDSSQGGGASACRTVGGVSVPVCQTRPGVTRARAPRPRRPRDLLCAEGLAAGGEVIFTRSCVFHQWCPRQSKHAAGMKVTTPPVATE